MDIATTQCGGTKSPSGIQSLASWQKLSRTKVVGGEAVMDVQSDEMIGEGSQFGWGPNVSALRFNYFKPLETPVLLETLGKQS